MIRRLRRTLLPAPRDPESTSRPETRNGAARESEPAATVPDDRRLGELLGDEADGLSDHEVDLIRQHADAMAHIIVEMFLENRTTLE